jgi:hypothetical protein
VAPIACPVPTYPMEEAQEEACRLLAASFAAG